MRSIVEEALTKVSTEPAKVLSENEELDQILKELKTEITVIGCGGSGSNTITRMKEEGIPGANLIAMNTDAQHLARTQADHRILIGRQRTRGLGAGSIPQIGEEAAIENEQDIKKMVSGSDMVFITVGLGGGTGTGAAPIVAKAARDEGALTIAVVTLPFTAEGAIRMENAEAGLERLRDVADTVIVVPNDRLLEVVPRLPLNAAFKVADEVLMRAVKGITELITMPGLVNLHFADVAVSPQDVQAAAVGLVQACFEVAVYKTSEREAADVSELSIVVAAADQRLVDAAARGRTVGECVNLARSLSNEPGNVLTPGTLAEQAQAVASEVGLGIDVSTRPASRPWGCTSCLAWGRAAPRSPGSSCCATSRPTRRRGPCWGWWGRGSRSTLAASRSSHPRAWRR